MRAVACALAAVAVAYVAAEDACYIKDGRDHRDGEQCQRPAHLQHDDDDEDEHEDVLEDRQHAGGEHLVERIDIRGDAGYQLADGVMVEEGGRHALQVAEDLAAQVEHDLLAGPLHGVGLQKLQQVGDEERAEVEKTDLRDAGHRARAEVLGKPGELRRRRVRHVGVDRDLDEVGPHDVTAGFEDDGERRQRRLHLVRTEVGQQTAHESAVVDLACDLIVLSGFFRGPFCRVLRFLLVCHVRYLF